MTETASIPSRHTLNGLFRRLANHIASSRTPVTEFMRLQGHDPYRVLVCTVLSARTRDQVTLKVADELLRLAPDPPALRALDSDRLQAIVRPCGFYRTKAAHLQTLARHLSDECHDRVPDSFAKLLQLPGVGPKTANLVLALGYRKATISVDIHVHRISNRLGLVETGAPETTENELKHILPRRVWSSWNPWLVALGQTVCLPRNPRCEICPIANDCLKRI